MNITRDLEVCTDCAMLIANGECADGITGYDISQEIAEAQVALWGEGIDGAMGLVLDTGEPHFSSNRCDGCGSTDAADRFPAAHIASRLEVAGR
ncbi:hypothetical protein [Georgenia deserti]|uniref:Uncharacterized protein n=1 Tax=Georgenia deserti TaxID=2093781 RepID=A0ABW4L440_9MICO